MLRMIKEILRLISARFSTAIYSHSVRWMILPVKQVLL
jgi:hypothetical protein